MPERLGWAERLRALEAALERAFVPPELRGDPIAARAASLVAEFAFVPLLFVPVMAATCWISFPAEVGRRLALLALISAPTCAAVPIVLRYTGSAVLAGNWMLAWGFVLFAVIGYYSGGALSPPSFWNVLLPMSAVALVGRRWAALWAALVLGEAIAVAWFERNGLRLENQVLPEHRALYWFVSIASLASLIALAALVFERSKDLTLHTLESANAELARARDAAERASAAKSDFLATLTHEVRTPMTAILGFADVLLDEWRERGFDERHQDALATIQRSGRELLETINDLLDLSKIEAGKLELEQIAFSPSELIAGVVEGLRPKAAAQGLALEFERVLPLPGVVRSDPARLRQIAAHLVESALRFTSRGGIRVSLGLARDEEREQIELRVRDTGRGIETERLDALFHPGVRGERADPARGDGVELGLTMCKRLTELLGGRIEAESAAGVGSTFRVLVPFQRAEGSDAPPAPRAGGAAPALRARVLVVDDGPDNLRLITHLLRRAGAEVASAGDGQSALARIGDAERAGRPFDVVLMDMQMPGMDGYAATSELRRRGFTRPILALTAHAVHGTREACLAAGCDDFATKPVDRRELLERIRRLCPHLV